MGRGRTETLHLCGLALVTASLTRQIGCRLLCGLVSQAAISSRYTWGGRALRKAANDERNESYIGTSSSPNPIAQTTLGTGVRV